MPERLERLSDHCQQLLRLQTRVFCFQILHSGLNKEKLRCLAERYNLLADVLIPKHDLEVELVRYYQDQRMPPEKRRGFRWPEFENGKFFINRSPELLARDIYTGRRYLSGEVTLPIRNNKCPARFPITLRTLIRWERAKIQALESQKRPSSGLDFE